MIREEEEEEEEEENALNELRAVVEMAARKLTLSEKEMYDNVRDTSLGLVEEEVEVEAKETDNVDVQTIETIQMVLKMNSQVKRVFDMYNTRGTSNGLSLNDFGVLFHDAKLGKNF